MALVDEYKNQKPLSGARIVGCLHMTIQTAVLIETLVELVQSSMGFLQYIFDARSCRGSYCKKIPVFAYKNESLEECWICR